MQSEKKFSNSNFLTYCFLILSVFCMLSGQLHWGCFDDGTLPLRKKWEEKTVKETRKNVLLRG